MFDADCIEVPNPVMVPVHAEVKPMTFAGSVITIWLEKKRLLDRTN